MAGGAPDGGAYQPKLDALGLTAFLGESFPQALAFPWDIRGVGEGWLELTLAVDQRHLRPGGTVSGPTLMTMADTAMYLLVLSALGPVALAVTSHLDIDFLRKPGPGELHARAEMLKLGRRLAVGRVLMYSDDASRPVAHASVTYALPSPPEGI